MTLIMSHTECLPKCMLIVLMFFVMSITTAQVIPNDPLFSTQYALNRIKAPEAWTIATGGETVQGRTIVIAVLDDGFDLSHPDISFWTNYGEIPNNGIDDDSNGYIDDFHGWNTVSETDEIEPSEHGTHVAGIAGARGNNAIGVSGLNWNVKIMPIQVFDGNDLSEPDILDGYNYILQNRLLYEQSNGQFGAFIVATNASFSKAGWHPSDHDDWCAIFDELGSAGILNVVGAQNQSVEIDAQGGFPPPPNNYSMPAMCSSPFIIVPTNVNSADELASDAPWSITHFDIAAPGVDIVSTVPGGTGEKSGVSMAAPLVAGTVALIHSAGCSDFALAYDSQPAQVALDIRKAIINNADFIPGLLPLIGGGRLNVYRSIRSFMEEHLASTSISGSITDDVHRTAINFIDIHDVSSSNDILAQAGQAIMINSNTVLSPDESNYQLFEINPIRFACAVPYEPLELGLYAPSTTYCNTPFGVVCNAVVSGGVSPFTYSWRSRLLSSTSWQTNPSTIATCFVHQSGSFLVDVRVTDAIGNVATAGPAIVLCTQGLVTEPAGMDLHADEYRVEVWPNPAPETVNMRVSMEREGEEAVVSIFDATGRMIGGSRRLGAGVEPQVLSLTLPSGTYYAVVELNGQRITQRFLILP